MIRHFRKRNGANKGPVRRLLACACLFLLAGCATTPEPLTTIANWERYQARLAKLDSWQLRGKIIVRARGESEKARVNWRQNGEDYKIRFSGTLGMGTTYLYGAPQQVRLEQSGEPPLVAASAEELVYQQLGQQIPVSALRYWVRGIPAPGTPVTNLDLGPQGNLAGLEQAGWQLRYQEYVPVGAYNLPGELTATHPEVALTISISDWQLPNQP